MASVFADLSVQSWVVLAFFALYILYMLLMTYYSPAYRLASSISSPWMFVYLVLIVVAYAVIIIVGVGCASNSCDARNARLCALWSWLIAALVAFGVLYTIFLSFKANWVHSKKEQESFIQ